MGPAIGLGLGALSGAISHNQKKGEYNRQKQLAADQERYSPWTGVHGNMPTNNPNMMGDLLQGGISGLKFGSQFGGGSPDPMGGAAAGPQVAGGYEESPWASAMGSSPTMYG